MLELDGVGWDGPEGRKSNVCKESLSSGDVRELVSATSRSLA